MFNASILELQSQISYYQEQCKLAEQELVRLKMTEAFAEDAATKVSEALEHIDSKYLDVFKEHLLSLFPTEAPVYLEEKVEEDLDKIEYLDDSNPDYKSIEQLQQEDPDTVVAVFHSEQHLKEQEEKSEKSYYELTGRPDLRPTTHEDLAPNISYSSDGRAYVGFNDKQEAEEFRDSISEPSLLDDAQIMNNYKWEVKFYCDREYLEQFVEVQTSNIEKIDGEIIYNHVDSICYVAFSAKGRADNYGSYLTRILDIGEKYTVSKTPSMFDSKYELRLEGINFEDALHLQSFKLKRDYDHPDNKQAREVWRTTRKREILPACNPLPRSTPLDEINLGEIVYLNSII